MSRAIAVTDLSVGYGARRVASPGSFELTGERVTLVIGANGVGKTTLLKTLAGLLPPIAGSITPRLQPGPGGAVFAHSTPFLFGGTVRTNLLLAAHGDEAKARETLGSFHAEGLWDRRVHVLSAGQRQRVSLARAFAVRPALVLADEPEGGMDLEAIDCWRGVMQRAVADRDPIIVIAAHSPLALNGVPVQMLSL